MKTIRHASTLYYYDGPQVVEALDDIGGRYIAVMIEPDEVADRYVVAGTPPELLRRFKVGALDLRSLLLESAKEEWFIVFSSVVITVVAWPDIPSISHVRLGAIDQALEETSAIPRYF